MSRSNPRHYAGTVPTSHSLDKLLGKWLRGFERRAQDRPEKVFLAWDQVVGPRIAELARPISFEGGILRVYVQNATLLSLLAGLERANILRQLKKQHHLPIQHIHFLRG